MGKENKDVIVPEQWFKSLLQYAIKAEQEMNEWEVGKVKRFKVSALIGYARSAEYVLTHNKRTKSNAKNIFSNFPINRNGCVHPNKTTSGDKTSYWCKDCEQYVM